MESTSKAPLRSSSRFASLPVRTTSSKKIDRFQPFVLDIPSNDGYRQRNLFGRSSVSRTDSHSLPDRDQQGDYCGVFQNMSQLTSCSQPSINENHDTISIRSSRSLSRFPGKSAFPPLHQSSSASSSSGNGYRSGRSTDNRSIQSKSVSLQSRRLRPKVTQFKIVSERNEVLPARSSENRSLGGASRLLQRMTPRRIGNGFSNGLKSLPQIPSLRSRPMQSSQPIPSDSSTMASSKESQRPDSTNTACCEEENLKSLIHSECKAYFEKNQSEIDDAFRQNAEKQSELQVSIRHNAEHQSVLGAKLRRFDEQTDKFDGKLQSANALFESKQREFNEDFLVKTSAMEDKATSYIKSIEEAGKCQVEKLSKTLKKLESKYDQVVQGIPAMIQPTLVEMVKALVRTSSVPAVVEEGVSSHNATKTVEKQEEKPRPTAPKIGQSSSKKQKKQERDVSPDHQEDTKATVATTKRRSQRRGKRAKDDSEKENKTPPSKRARPCVTPPGENSKQGLLSQGLGTNGTGKTRAKKSKVTSTVRSRKQATAGVPKISTNTNERIPFEVIEVKARSSECLSPLEIPSVVKYPVSLKGKRQTVSRPKVSISRGRRKRSYDSRSTSSSIAFQDDSLFTFC